LGAIANSKNYTCPVLDKGRGSVNEATAFFRQDGSEFVPDPLDDIGMASLAKIRIRHAAGGCDGWLKSLLIPAQIIEDLLI
jgi:hypothetical protein